MFYVDRGVHIRANATALPGTKSHNHSSVRNFSTQAEEEMCLNNTYLRRWLMQGKPVLSVSSRGHSEFTQRGKNGEVVHQGVYVILTTECTKDCCRVSVFEIIHFL